MKNFYCGDKVDGGLKCPSQCDRCNDPTQHTIDRDGIYKGLVVNDYELTPYAQWIKEGRKPIETRMNRIFSYRGDIIICCGKTNSVSQNRGKALCIVELYAAGDMQPEHAEAACIEWHPQRKSHMLRNWRYFSENFEFSKMAIQKNFQGMFDMTIPTHIKIIPQPQILPYKL